MNHPIGSETLSIHLKKNCSACIEGLKKMGNLIMMDDDNGESKLQATTRCAGCGETTDISDCITDINGGFFCSYQCREDPKSITSEPANDFPNIDQDDTGPETLPFVNPNEISETIPFVKAESQAVPEAQDDVYAEELSIPIPDEPAKKSPDFRLDQILESWFASKDINWLLESEDGKKAHRLLLFNTVTIEARKLFERGENGSWNYDKAIKHGKFLEECIKDLKTVHQAHELARLDFIKSANLEERARISESDKKYKPMFAEREKEDKIKETGAEKNIKKLMKAGLSRDVAERIIFGTAKG